MYRSGWADFYCHPWQTGTAGILHFPLAGIHWKKISHVMKRHICSKLIDDRDPVRRLQGLRGAHI